MLIICSTSWVICWQTQGKSTDLTTLQHPWEGFFLGPPFWTYWEHSWTRPWKFPWHCELTIMSSAQEMMRNNTRTAALEVTIFLNLHLLMNECGIKVLYIGIFEPARLILFMLVAWKVWAYELKVLDMMLHVNLDCEIHGYISCFLQFVCLNYYFSPQNKQIFGWCLVKLERKRAGFSFHLYSRFRKWSRKKKNSVDVLESDTNESLLSCRRCVHVVKFR